MPPKKSNDDAFSDNVTTVKAWIEATKGKDKKAVVNKAYSTDGKKHTMLYRACRLGRFEVAKMLVEDFGADVNVQNGGEDKSVPLHGACYGGSPPCVALLVQHGAKVDAQNAHGETPLDNAKSPADGVKKAFATKCQKLLKDSAACVEQLKIANENVAKIAEISSGVATVGSKTAASTAEAADEKKPAKKVAKKEAVPTGPHPLHGKTVVFTGTFKVKKNLHEVAVTGFGGKSTGSVSAKTDYIVVGKNPGDKEYYAVRRGIPLWTEEQFEAVCKDGWSAVPPPKPVPAALQCLVDTMKLEESYRKALISSLTYDFETFVPNQFNKSCLYFQGAIPAKGNAPTVGSFGADLIAPIITAWPGDFFLVSGNQLKDSDVKSIMEAIVARGDGVAPMKCLNMGGNSGITDEGAEAIANSLPKTSLNKIYLYGSTISKPGVVALLKALEETPSMQCLEIQEVSGAKEAHEEWKAGSGKNCDCTVLVQTVKFGGF